MPTAIVTGGAGFVGSHLAEALVQRGYDVTVIDNCTDAPVSNLNAVLNEIRLMLGDVRDPDIGQLVKAEMGSRPIDTIFHLAANASVPRSSQNPMHDASVNIIGTINMLALARKYGAHFLLASSGAVYDAVAGVRVNERHPTRPVSAYGASKLAAEEYVRLHRENGHGQATIARLFNIYGPRQRRYAVFDFACRIVADGEELAILGSGNQVRSQLYVLDAIDALLLVEAHARNETCNIGSSTEIRIEDLAKKMQDTFGTRKRMRPLNDSWEGDVEYLVPDTKHLLSLGFKESYSLDQGLSTFRDWFMELESPR